MWGRGFFGGDDEDGASAEQRRADAAWLEEIVKRHTLRVALIGLVLAGGLFLLAYLTRQRRLMAITLLLLTISLPLLVWGLVKMAKQAAQGPLRCPHCGASEREKPGFARTHPKSVSYDVVRCQKCGMEWTDRR